MCDGLEISLIPMAKVGHGRDPDLFAIFPLREKHQRSFVNYPAMAWVPPRPHARPRRNRREQQAICLKDSIELAELRKEEAPIPLSAGVLQHLVGVDLIEVLRLEGEGKLLQIPNYIRLRVRIQIQRH